jgi:hypothetical protein
MIRDFVISTVGHALLLGTFFYWTGISDSTMEQFGISALIFAGWLLALLLLERWLFRAARWRAAMARRDFWLSILLFAAMCVTSNLVVHWVPNVPGVAWQLTSFALRFGLSWLALNALWINVARQASLPPIEDNVATVPGE